MASLNLGTEFAAAVLQAAGLDPLTHEPDTMIIDMVPALGEVTVRVTRTFSVDASILRKFIGHSALPEEVAKPADPSEVIEVPVDPVDPVDPVEPPVKPIEPPVAL